MAQGPLPGEAMSVLILGSVVVLYIGIAVLVARLCSINSRWEEILDRIPGPRVTPVRTRAPLLSREDDLADDSKHPAPHVS